jgi:hypothetical protein
MASNSSVRSISQEVDQVSLQVCKTGVLVKRFYSTLVCAIIVMTPALSHAAVTAKDVEVAARVFNFTSPPYSGTVKLGIVYDPANASSAADEQALLGILGSGLTVGSVTLVPVPVPAAKLASTPVDVLFLTAGLGSEAAEVGTQAASAKILCITTDAAATQAGYCAVSVQSDPKVVIAVNKAAAAASGVSFTSAFLMMVTEI